MKKVSVIIILSLILSLASYSVSFGAVASGTDKVKGNMAQYMKAMEDNNNFQGSVLVEKGGKVLIDQGFGLSDVEKNIKNSNKSTFPIGSVTKQFTAMAIMQLQQKGLLNVNDKLSKYIPDYPRGNEITLHNLLTHTSGIANFPLLDDLDALGTGKISITDVIKRFENKPLDFKPGSKWSYSNSGYILLGYIVEKVSKLSLEDYLKKNIFIPLKMNNTGACYKGDKKMYSTNGYAGYLEVQPSDDSLMLKILYGSGFLYSTVEDLAIWDRALYTEKLVSKKILNQIFTPYVKMNDTGLSYGYGWVVSGNTPIKEAFHDGSTLSSASMLSMNIEKNLRIIILCNRRLEDVYTLKSALNDIASGKKVTLPVKKQEITLTDYNKYVGTYQASPGMNFTITNEDNKLFAKLTGQDKAEIYPRSETEFFYKIVDAEIVFTEADKGAIQSLTLNQLGQKIKADKISDTAEVKKEVQVDSKISDSYVGEYELNPGVIVSITKEEDKVFAQITGQPKVEIFPESETTYFYKVVDAQIIFEKDSTGAVTVATLKQAGQNYTLKKIK